jgi:hypothetical protein
LTTSLPRKVFVAKPNSSRSKICGIKLQIAGFDKLSEWDEANRALESTSASSTSKNSVNPVQSMLLVGYRAMITAILD